MPTPEINLDRPWGGALPSMEHWLLLVPLYESLPFREYHLDTFDRLRNFGGSVDTHCIWCDQPSVFRSASVTRYSPLVDLPKESFTHRAELACVRNRGHVYSFDLLITSNAITKIGQWPSVADLVLPEIAAYRRVLGKATYGELSRALGLAAHGIGIGSFVYLRRIFEGLVEEAHALAASEAGWDEAIYTGVRMDEKIRLLRQHLPEFLVQNRSLYGILSKGVHELSEQECLTYFSTVRLGLELILDEKIERLAREAKLKRGRAEIEDLARRLGGAPPGGAGDHR